MGFTSPIFYLGLAVATIAFYWIPGRFRAIYLLALSYAFYAVSSKTYLVLLVIATAICFAIGLGIAKARGDAAKSRLMTLGVASIVALVVAFKAAGAIEGVLLPLGVSYYSFKLISYLIEVYWDDEAVERDPVVFFLFPAFFPQIVSGPIQRPESFFRQMREIMGRAASDAQIETGFRFILGGLMLKLLIGDRLADVIDQVDSAHGDFTQATIVMVVALYTLQLYADFAGYTNIALGVGKLFGIEGPPNFNAPFAATNLQEMWRRWHMSLTSWLTDYLFTPLSMSLRSLGLAGALISIMANMLAIGLWHGFTLNFLVFGLLQGICLAATFLALRVVRKRLTSGVARDRGALVGYATAAMGRLLTFMLLSVTMIFFHSPTWGQAVSVAGQALGLTPSGPLTLVSLGPGAAVSAAVCAAVALFDGSGSPGAGWAAAWFDRLAPRWLQNGVSIFLLVALSTGGGRFIYGQF